MKRNKKALILALVVGLFLATALPAVSQGPPREGEGPPGEGLREQACLACIPDMTAEQLEAIQNMREEHRDEMEGIREELHEAKMTFHELMREPEPDLNAVRQAKENVDDLETKMLIAHLEMRLEIRGMLTADQRVFFDEMHMHGPHQGPGGHHPMGPGPGGPGEPGMGPGGPHGP